MVASVGKIAPAFKASAVVDGAFKDVSLDDYKGQYVVLFFYPLDFTLILFVHSPLLVDPGPNLLLTVANTALINTTTRLSSFVCPTEIIAFSEAIERFSALKTAVLACSCDSQFSHLAWVNTDRKNGGLGEMKIPLIADFTKKIATDYGVLKEDEGVAYRGLFIIDPNQVVRQITINDLPVGRNVDEIVRLVEAFQFTDEHGEVCPIGWQKGQATIKPDVSGSKEFFASSA
ncbi:hypothetical protein KVV02_002220 [Mortierella alpina]|uniref:Thioredoxin domain-containing protein n=1 Tax=Mortierella alpina TaxID=64518 RepID=A0A9P8A0E8_MORAP|nr:hypothetical protein KVV02_002220 [Mortierella alpina]